MGKSGKMLLPILASLGRPILPSDPLEGIDVHLEYKLILIKKSRLSANLRRLIIQRMEKQQPPTAQDGDEREES